MNFASNVSRRSFIRIAGATAISSPLLTEAHLAWAQVGRRTPLNVPPDAVLINANENPMGPCPAACDAIAKAGMAGGRYDFARTNELIKVFSEQQGLKPVTSPSMPAQPSRCTSPCSRSHRPSAATSPPTPDMKPDNSPPVSRMPKSQRSRSSPTTRTTSRPWSPPTPTPASSTSAIPTTPPAPSPQGRHPVAARQQAQGLRRCSSTKPTSISPMPRAASTWP